MSRSGVCHYCQFSGKERVTCGSLIKLVTFLHVHTDPRTNTHRTFKAWSCLAETENLRRFSYNTWSSTGSLTEQQESGHSVIVSTLDHKEIERALNKTLCLHGLCHPQLFITITNTWDSSRKGIFWLQLLEVSFHDWLVPLPLGLWWSITSWQRVWQRKLIHLMNSEKEREEGIRP